MADEQYGWLDRETAERLLRGEPLDAVDADARAQAERLADALGALSSEPAPTSTELPGEAAALAAFRSARAGRPAVLAEHADASSAPRRAGGAGTPDAGLFRLGASRRAPGGHRWVRPLRYALAASLAVGMVGGVALAAGTGVLPTPFDDAEPGPASSVSTAAPPRLPTVTPSPDALGGTARPETSGEPGGAGRDVAGGGGRTPGGRNGLAPDAREGTGRGLRNAASACRAVRDGRHLAADRRRALEGAAGGSGRVWSYCKGLLAELDSPAHRGGQDGDDQGGAGSGKAGRGAEKGRSGDGDSDSDEGGGDRHRGGHERGRGGGDRGGGDQGRGHGGDGGDRGDSDGDDGGDRGDGDHGGDRGDGDHGDRGRGERGREGRG
ncbi:hypothetical protein [Streptomyces sp. NPDC005017]|uniref:hypothetical protein n=1 Tax=Streptomyces sp. NPDC005017 TaxID=3364706 RepID=UPI0036B5E6CC